MVFIILHNSHNRKLFLRSISIPLSSVIDKISTRIFAVKHFAPVSFDSELPKALSDLTTHFKSRDSVFWCSVTCC